MVALDAGIGIFIVGIVVLVVSILAYDTPLKNKTVSRIVGRFVISGLIAGIALLLFGTSVIVPILID